MSAPASAADGIAAAENAVVTPRLHENRAEIGVTERALPRGPAHDSARFENVVRVNLIRTFNCASRAAAKMADAP